MTPPETYRTDESFARELDAADTLSKWRDRFHIPTGANGEPVIYLCGNSLGLQPRTVRRAVERELEDWAALGVGAHFAGRTPWYSYHEVFRESGARLVGAQPGEVVMMNGLTVNLHLMMVSFYRPTRERCKILIEDSAFPSDLYAVQTQIRYHGFDPDDALLVATPREGEHALRTEDIEALIEREGHSIALVLFAGVNYRTGQVFDMLRIASAARRQGCAIGFDLAHAAGNVELRLHDWDVDFAVWCTYKYLNCGPGSAAGCFVHERHTRDADLPRFGGWWGNDPKSRFAMHAEKQFKPVASADAWQLSNPPILSMAALKASLAIFDEIGMSALRAKSVRLTGCLQYLLDHLEQCRPAHDALGAPPLPGVGDGRDEERAGLPRETFERRTVLGDRISPPPSERMGHPGSRRFEVITPPDPAARGCQLSILIHDRPRELFEMLQAEGVVGDFRQPNIIRIAPVPLYNTFHEVWRFARLLVRYL